MGQVLQAVYLEYVMRSGTHPHGTDHMRTKHAKPARTLGAQCRDSIAFDMLRRNSALVRMLTKTAESSASDSDNGGTCHVSGVHGEGRDRHL